jgi:hypothetical protein
MNNSDIQSKKDNVVSVTWPDPLSATVDSPYCPDILVPQSTHLDLVSDLGYTSTVGHYVPNFNAADDAAYPPAPTTEMGAFTDLLTQLDLTIQASNQCAGTPISSYPPMPQNTLDPWPIPAPCMFLSRTATILLIHQCGSKASFDERSAVTQPQLLGGEYWTGAIPNATDLVAATPDVSANTSD